MIVRNSLLRFVISFITGKLKLNNHLLDKMVLLVILLVQVTTIDELAETKMDSVKKVLTSYTRFMAKSKALLAFTLAVSLLLNLVLFLRIPQHSKPDIVQRYSEESFAALFEAVPRKRHVVGQTNTTVDHKRTKQLSKSHELVRIFY